jgi:hypothetical protein
MSPTASSENLWTPDDVVEKALRWFDIANSSSMLDFNSNSINGDLNAVISEMSDLSAYEADQTQSTVSQMPTYDAAQKGLVFDETSLQYMTSIIDQADNISTKDFMMIYVMSIDVLPYQSGGVVHSIGGSERVCSQQFGNSSNMFECQNISEDFGETTTDNKDNIYSNSIGTAKNLLSNTRNFPNSETFFNGSSVETTTNLLDKWRDAKSEESFAKIYNNYTSLTLHEMLIFDSTDNALREKSEGYLWHKWDKILPGGMPNELPDWHKYKNNPPTV